MYRYFHIVCVTIMAVIWCLPVFAASTPEPYKEPILRVETTRHAATIYRVASDGAGRFLATASEDKTVRVWDAVSGQLLRVIRPPLGGGNEGKLYTLAVSPDGSLIACGGWTKLGGDTGHTIYLFNRASGAMLRRFPGMPNVVDDLAFSPDGQLLAVALGGSKGIRVIRHADGRELFSDTEVGGRTRLTFDRAGRLAVASYDGSIRLYDPRFQKIATVASTGREPKGIAFSPDGSLLAIGYIDKNLVEIRTGNDLSLLHRQLPPQGKPSSKTLSAIAWSSDGFYLYAAGTEEVRSSNGQMMKVIRRWDQQGSGSFVDIPVSENTVMSLLSLPGGRIAFATYDPMLGVLDQRGGMSLQIAPQITDFRFQKGTFQVSPDGRRVRYQPYRAQKPFEFDNDTRTLSVGQESTQQLAPPILKHENLQITDWLNLKTPKLNGQPLKLKEREISRSLSILPDGSGFVLGAEWSLRHFAADGSQRWEIAVPSLVWGVNVAWQARIVVAAYADGTIRWHRLSDGKTICSFFPHRDQKRWVLWTPGGYYDASPGGEELIGWHINNGREQAADFFPASKFRNSKYRPDVVAKVFETLDVKEALRLADAERGSATPVRETDITAILPPVVSIISPADGSNVSSSTVTVRYTVRSSNNEPVTAIRVLVDGRPVAASRGLKAVAKDSSEQTLQVSIPEKNSEISIIAENRNSSSEPATVRLSWAGKAMQQDEFVVKPKLYVLAVGVSAYTLPDLRLQFAAKDAKDFAAAVQAQKGGIYRDVAVRLLPDASKDDVLDGLEWLQKEVTSKDVAMVFLAGHGINDSAGTYYFLPVNTDPDKLKRTGVPFSDIKNTLAALAGKAILFVDTCHSGNVMGSGRRALADVNAVVNELASAENGVVVFASSTGRQYSLEDKAWGNGAFTKALVEGLQGKAEYSGKGKITINMLDLYLSERVKELTGGKQTPTTTKPQTIPDFPLALKR